MRLTSRALVALALAGGVIFGTGPVAALSVAPSITINFDDGVRPCNFSDTVALSTRYVSLGVRFAGGKGPGSDDGGGVLNQCGSFGVTGFSEPNFLAFNPFGDRLADGGIPAAPEMVQFQNPVSHVDILAGSGFGFGKTVGLRAFDDQGQLLDEDQINLTTQMQMLSVDASGIDHVRIVGGAKVFVVDDLHAS
jgi:hypothetical protein